MASPAPLQLESNKKVSFFTSCKISNFDLYDNLGIETTTRYVSLVSSRSVKLISLKTTEGEFDSWWVAVREEMRQHALALG